MAKGLYKGDATYSTSVQSALMVMQAMNKITEEQRFLKWFEQYAPLVVKELYKAGVRFDHD